MSGVWTGERRARAALTAVCEAASPQLCQQVAVHGPEEIWRALRTGDGDGRWSRRARSLDLDALRRTAELHDVRFIIPGDEEWPEQVEVLDQITVAALGGTPLGLWLRGPGHLAEWSAKAVALVGSRASSQYGDHVTTDLALDLSEPAPAEAGWTIISGGAYGIDGAAHRGALASGGRTIAVLASGLDEPYPRGNQMIFDRLATEHLLVSEVPCGMRPTRVAFLARNRLIAALSVGTVVVEAAARSGAANTANWAAECGRVVMAVPGPITSSLSVTPHRLVRDGKATLVSGSQDVLALVAPLARAPQLPVGGAARPLDGVPAELMEIREVLPARGTMPVSEVSRRAGVGMATALASLAKLEQLRLAAQDETGQWRILMPAST